MNKNILLSYNENPKYLQYLPLVCSTWRSWGFSVNLTFITGDPIGYSWVEKYADTVYYWDVRDDLDPVVWAKVARILTYHLPNDEYECVSDGDMLPLNKEYFHNLFTIRKEEEDMLHLFSADSHKDAPPPEGGYYGKFAGCYMLAKGSTWKEIINPKDLSTENLLESWKGRRKWDHKEDITQPGNIFSEESLMRRLVYDWSPKKKRIKRYNRGFVQGEYLHDRIDRSNWKIDLPLDYYIDSHLPRPLRGNEDKVLPLVDYLGLDTNLIKT